MYGYIRPDKGELRVREYELFRAAYCGLCETLREQYSLLARFVVNYDLTFMAMVLSGEHKTELRRCPVHPLKKRPCVCGGSAFAAAADYSVILARWKLEDSANDEKGGKAFLAGAGQALLKNAYEKAADRQPDFARNTAQCLRELAALEKENDPSLDRPADCFARILAFAAHGAENPKDERILQELFYHIGRYVYILDAVDDLREDVRQERYNPLRHRLAPGADKLDEQQRRDILSTLNLSQRSAANALALRGADLYQPILENILMIGLPEVTELVFSGRWNKRKPDGQGKVPVIEE